MSEKALVVLSGGQDSTTCLYWAREQFGEIHALTFDYNQRHRREIDAARRIAWMAGAEAHEVLEIGAILQGRSPLTNPSEQLEQYSSFAEMDKIIGDRVELTFVPMRNALFLVLAANRAVCKDITHVVTGVCEADNANYPDCRRVFISAMQDAINEALGRRAIEIHTPLITKSKAESIKLAMTLPGCYEALAYSHTAYDGAYPPLGKDHATVLRAQGFLEAGVPDPLIVRAFQEGLMPLPESPNYDSVRT